MQVLGDWAEPSPMDSEHPGCQQGQKTRGAGMGFDSGCWEHSVFSAPSDKTQWRPQLQDRPAPLHIHPPPPQ